MTNPTTPASPLEGLFSTLQRQLQERQESAHREAMQRFSQDLVNQSAAQLRAVLEGVTPAAVQEAISLPLVQPSPQALAELAQRIYADAEAARQRNITEAAEQARRYRERNITEAAEQARRYREGQEQMRRASAEQGIAPPNEDAPSPQTQRREQRLAERERRVNERDRELRERDRELRVLAEDLSARALTLQEPQFLAKLKRARARLQGSADATERMLRQLREDLTSIDAAIAALEPNQPSEPAEATEEVDYGDRRLNI